MISRRKKDKQYDYLLSYETTFVYPTDIDRFAFEGEARIAGDHETPFEPRQRGDDLLYHSVREILLLGIAAHVLERQHGDGGFVRE